jgi:membrane protease subunit HflC
MSPNKAFLPLMALLLVGIGLYSAAFYVRQWEVALKLRLGEIVSADYQPGLHFLVPILNDVRKFDSRIQTYDTKPERFLTVEKKDVLVDSYVKWRIANVAQYFRATGGGNAARAERLLSERINTRLRDEFGKRTIQEVVSGERGEIMTLLTKDADEQAAELGIQIVDVRVKKIDLPAEVSDSVYQRMRAERERVARDLRAKGAEAAERIRADADRQRTEIIADAYRESEVLRGEGDAKSAEVYANAFQKNAEFYTFWRSLGAYRSVFEKGGDLMVLDPNSDFFRYLTTPAGGKR